MGGSRNGSAVKRLWLPFPRVRTRTSLAREDFGAGGMSRAPPRSAFAPAERRVIDRANTPEKVQRWLESLPYNHEERGETLQTFRGVVRDHTAHCLEAALSAAT